MISNPTREALSRAFSWLAANEQEPVATTVGGDQDDLLRERVTALIGLRRILGASSNYDTEALARHWYRQFNSRDEVPIHELRSEAKRWLGSQPSDQEQNGRTTAPPDQIERWLSLDQGSLAQSDPVSEPPAFSLAIKRACARALMQWQEELRLNPHWNQANEAVPMNHPESQVNAYFRRLRLRQQQTTHSSSSIRNASPQREQLAPPVSSQIFGGIEHLLTSASNQCAVVGEPGVGKSALVQWLAWATQQGLIPEFELAIAIRLTDYVRYLELRPQLGIVEFFVASKLNEYTQHRDTAKCLQSAANKSGRFMFLIDGWDQVPPQFRRAVGAAIRRDTSDFYTVITSRITGPSNHVFSESETFEMLGFDKPSPAASAAAFPNAIGQLAQSERNPVYESVERNTLLQTMVQRLLNTSPALNQAQVFQQICSWLVEHARETSDARVSFTPKHLRSLESLAFRMSLDATESEYTFREDATGPDPMLPEAIVRTRFVRRVPGLIDRWAFLHPTIQQFLAARHLASLSEDMIEQHWQKALRAKHRVGVLPFFAGLNTQTQQTSVRLAMPALQKPDRFGVQTARIAQIAAAANWRRMFPDVWQQICDHLKAQAKSQQACEKAKGVLRNVSKHNDDVTPPHPAQPSERSNVVVESAETANDGNRGADPFEQLLAENQSATGSADHTQHLLQRVAFEPSRVGTDRWLHLLTTHQPLPGRIREPLTQLACRQLRQSPPVTAHDQPPLACHVRDQLVSSLMFMDPADVRIPGILAALSNSKIAAGQRMLASWVRSKSVPCDVRLAACSLLHHVVDSTIVQDAVNLLPTEQSPDLADALLNLAVARRAIPNRGWMEKRIRVAAQQQGAAFFRETDLAKLIAVYVMTFATDGVERSRDNLRFIEPFIRDALAAPDHTKSIENHARSMATNFGFYRPGKLIAWTRELKLIARDSLNQCTADDSESAGRLGLALIILLDEPDWVALAQRILDQAISIIERPTHYRDTKDWHWLAGATAAALAKRSLSTLLGYPPDIECVRNALGDYSIESGTIIFARQAHDAEGRCVVDLDDGFITPNVNNQGAHVRHDTWSALPPMQHRALRSFQLVTEYIGSSATLEEIHATIDNGAEPCPQLIREQLDQLYRDVRFPTLNTWRRSLNHATRKLHASTDGQSLLQELGLPRRSSQ